MFLHSHRQINALLFALVSAQHGEGLSTPAGSPEIFNRPRCFSLFFLLNMGEQFVRLGRLIEGRIIA
jgi:hypothetical protein